MNTLSLNGQQSFEEFQPFQVLQNPKNNLFYCRLRYNDNLLNVKKQQQMNNDLGNKSLVNFHNKNIFIVLLKGFCFLKNLFKFN